MFNPLHILQLPLRNSRRGLTVVELLLVVAIVGVLLSLLLGVLSRSRRAVSLAGCQSNLRQIGLGFQQYVNEHNGHYPPHWGSGFNGSVLTWYGHIAPYITEWKGKPAAGMSRIFHCPANPRPHNPTQTYLSSASNMDQSYGYNFQHLSGNPAWRGVRITTVANAQKLVLAGDIPTYQDPDDIVRFPSSIPWLRLYPAMAPDGVSGLNAISKRHTGGANLLFLDGHVERRDSRALTGNHFDPKNWEPVKP